MIDYESLKGRKVEIKNLGVDFQNPSYKESCLAFYGIIKLIERAYFLVVKESEKVAEISCLNLEIFRSTKMEFIPVNKKPSNNH